MRREDLKLLIQKRYFHAPTLRAQTCWKKAAVSLCLMALVSVTPFLGKETNKPKAHDHLLRPRAPAVQHHTREHRYWLRRRLSRLLSKDRT